MEGREGKGRRRVRNETEWGQGGREGKDGEFEGGEGSDGRGEDYTCSISKPL